MSTSPMIDLTTERVNRGLSVIEAAAEMGVHEDVVRRAESGRGIRERHRFAIASFYGYQVTDIWPVDREPAPEAA